MDIHLLLYFLTNFDGRLFNTIIVKPVFVNKFLRNLLSCRIYMPVEIAVNQIQLCSQKTRYVSIYFSIYLSRIVALFINFHFRELFYVFLGRLS